MAAAFFVFSCGFLEEAQFQSRSSGAGSGSSSGSGRVPDLSKRIGSSPRISKNRCKDSESCQQVCEDLYNNLGSYRNCYDLSIGEVSDMQELVDALTEEEHDEQKNLLKQVKGKTVALYIEAGLDGFNEEVMGEIEDFSGKENNYREILKWIATNKDVAEAFREEDTDHETLKNLLINYKASLPSSDLPSCFTGSSPPTASCGNGNFYSICSHKCTSKHIYLNSQNELNTNPSEDPTVSIESSQKNLLIALSVTDTDTNTNYKNFFAAAENQPEAFALGHSLLEEACTNDNDDNEADHCMARFYCWLGGSTLSSADITGALTKIKSEVPRKVRSKVTQTNCGWPTPTG